MTKWLFVSLMTMMSSIACAKTQGSSSSPANPSTAERPPQATLTENLKLTALTNRYREEENLGAVRLDPQLSQIALLFARDMMNRNYFDHVTPDGVTMSERLQNGHILFRAAGENIAKGQRDEDAVMIAWMNSPGHRRNIMNGRYGKIGFAHMGPYWVMELTD